MQEKRQPVPKKQTMTNSLLGFVLRVIFGLLIALFFSILIEIIGMKFWWADEGVNHSRDMYLYELSHLDIGSSGLSLSLEQMKFANDALALQSDVLNFLGIGSFFSWLHSFAIDGDGPFKSIYRSLYYGSEQYFEAAGNVTKVFSVRLIILILSLPLFIFAFAVGVVDGLVERDLRRWGGGRESSTVYELAKAAVAPTVIGAWVIYLSLPVSINPSYVIVPFVFLFGFSVRVTTERLKKYF